MQLQAVTVMLLPSVLGVDDFKVRRCIPSRGGMWDLPTIWDQSGLLKESCPCWCLQSNAHGSRYIDMSIYYVDVMSCWEGCVWQRSVFLCSAAFDSLGQIKQPL